jgi:peptide-methionine (R)-S-oxide reductase
MNSRREIVLQATGAVALIAMESVADSASAEGVSQRKFEVVKSNAEWQRELTPEQYAVLRRHDTERPWTSPLNKEDRPGTYLCAGCDLPLFSSNTKFESGTGWPSFWASIEAAIETSEDRSFLFLVRTEVHCSRCGGHLGHVFKDGPQPTGLRYCMNGVALKFRPENA